MSTKIKGERTSSKHLNSSRVQITGDELGHEVSRGGSQFTGFHNHAVACSQCSCQRSQAQLEWIIPSTHDENKAKRVRVPVGAVQQGHNVLLYQLILHPGVNIIDATPNIISQELNLDTNKSVSTTTAEKCSGSSPRTLLLPVWVSSGLLPMPQQRDPHFHRST